MKIHLRRWRNLAGLNKLAGLKQAPKKIWLMMVRNITETIENLHCFYKADDEIITYLKDLVLFFSYASIYGKIEDWKELVG